MSQTVVAYLIYSTGLLIQSKNARTYHCRWLDESKVVRSKDRLKPNAVHDRAKDVFQLLRQKADVIVLINGSQSFFDVIEMIADTAKEHAREIKVITMAMAQLMTVPPLFLNQNMVQDALIRVVTIFETKERKPFFDGEEHILRRVGSNYLLTEHYPDHRIVAEELAETSHCFDYTVFIGKEFELKPDFVFKIKEIWPSDQALPLWKLYNRYDYFHCEGALLKGFEMLTVLPENDIIDFSSGFDAVFEDSKTMKTERVELVQYGAQLPVEIHGIDKPRFNLFYHPEAMRDHATVRQFSKPCSGYYFDSKDGELLYFIGKDGVPRKSKPEEVEDPYPSSSWTDLQKPDSDGELAVSDTSEEENETEPDAYPFVENTRLILCVDLKSGYVLFQDYSKRGQQYITRYWSKPTKLTEEVCKILLEKLPKKYVYTIINFIGSLTEEEMNVAQSLFTFKIRKLIWTSKKRAEVLYCIRKLGRLYVETNVLILVIYRTSLIMDIFYVQNKKIIDQERRYDGRTQPYKHKPEFVIKVCPFETIGTKHDSGLVFLVDKEFGDPDGTIKESPEELRLIGAYADARLLLKRCEYTGLENEEFFLPGHVEDDVEDVESYSDDGHLLVTLRDNKMKLEVVQGNHRELIKNGDDEEWTPMYFSMADGSPIVGQAAKNDLTESPKSVVFDLLKFMGKRLDNVEVNPEWQFELIDCDSGCIVQLELVSGSKRYNPHYILACIINAGLKLAESELGTTFNVIDVDVENSDSVQSQLIKGAIEMIGKKFGKFLS